MFTENERLVLDYLKSQGRLVSPTVIGLQVGGRTSSGLKRHSAWASPICKRLVEKGLAQRDNDGWYKFLRDEND